MIKVGRTVRACGMIFSLGDVADPCGMMALGCAPFCTTN